MSCSCQTSVEYHHISIVQLSQDSASCIYLHRSSSATFCPLGFVRSFHGGWVLWDLSTVAHHWGGAYLPGGWLGQSSPWACRSFSSVRKNKATWEMLSCSINILPKEIMSLNSSAVMAQVSFSAHSWAVCDTWCCQYSSLEQLNFWSLFVVSKTALVYIQEVINDKWNFTLTAVCHVSSQPDGFMNGFVRLYRPY